MISESSVTYLASNTVTVADAGWLCMRISIAWIFLWPLPGILKDWKTTVGATALVFPVPNLTTLAGVCVMIGGSLSVGLGIYGRIGAAVLALYCAGGVLVHMALSRQPAILLDGLHLKGKSADVANNAAAIGAVGNVTSAWKNWTIAGACVFIALAGTGRWSLFELLPMRIIGASQ